MNQSDQQTDLKYRCCSCGIWIRLNSLAGRELWAKFDRQALARSVDKDGKEVTCPACETGRIVGYPSPEIKQDLGFTARVFYAPLHPCVLVAGLTRIEGCWKAFCGPVPGIDHKSEARMVIDRGVALREPVARAIFPWFAYLDYAAR